MNHITKIILVQRKIIKVREEESQVARRAKTGFLQGGGAESVKLQFYQTLHNYLQFKGEF